VVAHPLLSRPDLEDELGRPVSRQSSRVDEHHEQQHRGAGGQDESPTAQAVEPSGKAVDERHGRHERDGDHEVVEPLDLEADREAGNAEGAERREQQGQHDLADGGQERRGGSGGEHRQARCEHSRCRSDSCKKSWPLPDDGGNTGHKGEKTDRDRRSSTAYGEPDGEQHGECGRQRLMDEGWRLDDSQRAQTDCDNDQGEHPRRLQGCGSLRTGARLGLLLITGDASDVDVVSGRGGSFAEG
jgi:hypothetical protein